MDYYYSTGGHQIGPISLDELLTKDIKRDTLVWKEGLADWVRASELPELANVLSKVPPPIREEVLSEYSQPICEESSTAPTAPAAYEIAETSSEPAMPASPVVDAPSLQNPSYIDNSQSVIDNTSMFRNWLLFRGRARRKEYWIICLISGVLYSFFDVISAAAYDSTGMVLMVLLFVMFYVWVLFSANTRRCHDLGHNGFWQFIPFYGLWMAFADSKPGTNKYGNNPKGE